MNKVRNTSWNNRLLQRQRIVTQPWLELPGLSDLRSALIGSRADVRQRGGVIPSWVPLTAIVLALSLLCISATLRTRETMQQAQARYAAEVSKVEQIRNNNISLQAEIEKLKTDPSAIADAAHQYGLIRPNEKVVMLR